MYARVAIAFLLTPPLVNSLQADPPSQGENKLGGHEVMLVDVASGRPVPLVKLQATNGLVWVTDNSGIACIDAPELMNRPIWLSVSSHGYECKADGFGMRGLRIEPTPGGTSKLAIERTMVAERVGRLTGSGLVAESQKLGRFRQWPESGVVGCDSTFVAPWKGKLFWIWGDTSVFHYPLGVFKTLGATSEIPPASDDSSPLLPKWNHFRDERGQLRGIAAMEHDGPVWLGGLVAIQDLQGSEHLVASYVKIQGKLEAIESGLCEWDEKSQTFLPTRTLWRQSDQERKKPNSLLVPDGHAVRFLDDQGTEQLVFVNPFPQVQMPCTYEAWSDPSLWTLPQLAESEGWASGTWRSDQGGQGVQEVVPHRGDMVWSARRSKWIAIFTQIGGKPSFLGEVWYAESNSPLGPWSPPIQIATHDNYTFYNPAIHRHMMSEESPYLYFEGTYTAEFADRTEKTPRYDYNQILYRVNLDELAKRIGR